MTRSRVFLAGCVFAAALLAACTPGPSDSTGAGTGNAGTSGAAGVGDAGASGAAGTSGSAGSMGEAGTLGASGSNGGDGSSAGTTGTAGDAGSTGVAGTTGTAGRGGTTGTAGRGGTTGTGGSGPATSTSTMVTTFHNNLGRTGVYVDAAMTRAAAAGIHVDTTFANTAIMGPVYAQPLYVGGAGTSQPDMVVVTTAQSRVYALNASTGAEVWPNVQVGPPVTTQLNISSSNRPLLPFGVVGTGTVDPATRTLYFNAAENVSSTIGIASTPSI